MEIVTQLNMFENEELGDLEKLMVLFNELPDEELIQQLDEKRKNGRDDYPNAVMWRITLSKFILEHDTFASLLRELKRNSQLRQLCGIQIKYVTDDSGVTKCYLAPSNAAVTRFINRLKEHIVLVENIFSELVARLYERLDDFGETLAIDGKIIESYANSKSNTTEKDGRRDLEAEFTKKVYKNKENQTVKSNTYYGYRGHIICDTKYEMPVALKVTPANTGEVPIARDLIQKMPNYQSQRCHYILADRGYDSTDLILDIEAKGMIPLIDNRHMWRGDQTKQYKKTDLIYDQAGNVWYVNDRSEEVPLKYLGYDNSSDSLRYGFKYPSIDNRIFRIKHTEDVRIFPKVGRTSAKYKFDILLYEEYNR